LANPTNAINLNLGTPFADVNLSGIFGYDDGTGTGLGPLSPITVTELEAIPNGLGPLTPIEVSELSPIKNIPVPRLKPKVYDPPLPPSDGANSDLNDIELRNYITGLISSNKTAEGASIPLVLRFPNSPGFQRHGWIQFGPNLKDNVSLILPLGSK